MTNFTCASRIETFPKIEVAPARIVSLLGFQGFNFQEKKRKPPK